MDESCALIVFAKAPVAGEAKTRLIPELGADGAARLAHWLLERTLRTAIDSGVGPLELCAAPDTSHPAIAAWAGQPGVTLAVQGEGDLGARMARALDRALQIHRRALLFGTDAPRLDATVLRQAMRSLDTHDAVFVPAVDGGYALVGLRRPVPQLFDAMPWSTSRVMACARERLQASGLDHAELAPLHDIDEPVDLVHLHGLGWA
jgi:uncharacterized protein